MKKIMLLGAGILQVPAIQKAKELGLTVIAVDRDLNAPGFQYADICLPVSTLDQDEIYRQALRLKPDKIITSTSDAPVYTAACVSARLGLKSSLTPEDALCATNKAYMRQRLKDRGVPIPEFYIAENKADFLQAVSRFQRCCVIKPADNAGSRGVRLFQKGENRFPEEVYAYSKSFSRSGTVLVEEFLEGPEASVEGFTVNGQTTIVAITDKLVTPPPYFVEVGHMEPCQQNPDVQKAIGDLAKKALEAIRIRNGPSHTEVKITKEGPKIVELAARLGGDFITSKLVPLSTGIDLVGASIQQEAGLSIDLVPKWHRGSAIRFFTAENGVLTAIQGLEDAKEKHGIEEIVFYRKIGDTITGAEPFSRVGHVIASADTAAHAVEICEQTKSAILIMTRK